MLQRILILMAATLVVVGCPKSQDLDSAENGSGQNAGSSANGSTSGLSNGDSIYGDGTSANAFDTKILYFDFDQSRLRPEVTRVVAAHADFMRQNSDASLVLEGHADERGSREYNIGLAERRAQAVKQAFAVQGIANSRLRTMSFGEEKPADAGHTELSWAQNRRVELRYE